MALLSYPSVGTGQSISSGSSAWAFGSFQFLFETNANTKTIHGISFQTTYVPSDDVTVEQLFEIATGPTGSETVKVQIPYSMRDDTGVGHYIQSPYNYILLPEPLVIPANTKVSIRVTDSIASALSYSVKVRVDGTRNLIESLTENFNDNSVDNKWFMTSASAARYTEQNSRLECTTLTTSGYYDFQSRESFDLRESAIRVKLVDPGTLSLASVERYPIYLTDASGQNGLFWLLYVGGGTGSLRCYKRVGGVQTQVGTTIVSYSVNTHKYFRIRESGGTTYFDWSTDGAAWTNHFSNANYIDMSDLYFKIETGNYAAEASGTTIIYDDINIGPTASSDSLLYIQGKTTDTSERLLYVQGKTTDASERGMYIAGKQSDSSERTMYITGATPGTQANSETHIYTTGKQSDTSERGMYLIGAEWHDPVQLILTKGAIVSGAFYDVYLDDNVKITLTEETGTPGFTYDFIFKGLNALEEYHVHFGGYYTGNHNDVKFQQWNFNTSTWDNVTTATGDIATGGSSDVSFDLDLLDTATHVSGGETRIRINHGSSGNPTHQLVLDFLHLETTASHRDIYIIGKSSDNSSRSLYIAGKTTDASERLMFMMGKSSDASERAIYAAGKQSTNSERGLYIAGKTTDSDERNLYVTGYQSDASERGMYLIANESSERGMYINGAEPDNSERGMYVVGKTGSERGLFIIGKWTRRARVDGNWTRQGNLAGSYTRTPNNLSGSWNRNNNTSGIWTRKPKPTETPWDRKPNS